MQPVLKFTSLLLLVFTIFSCNNNDDGKQVPTDKTETGQTYINYSVAGNQVNSTFSIIGDHNDSRLQAYGMVYPEDESSDLKVAGISFLDGNQLLSVGMDVPARTGLIELTDSHLVFQLGFGFENLSLEAKSVSMNIEAITYNDIYIKHIKGSFEGVAVYKFEENGNEMEETHLVSGDFEYTALQYQ